MVRFNRQKKPKEGKVMSQNDSILNLLGITDENITVGNVETLRLVKNNTISKVKIVYAKLTYNRKRCPQCGFNSLIKYGFKLSKLQFGIYLETPIRIYLQKQRFLCQNCAATCGVHTTLVKPNHTITNNLSSQVIKLAAQSIPASHIATLLGISPSSVERFIYDRKVIRYRTHSLPEHISFDEFRSVNQKFAFIAIDAKTHNLITILNSRRSKTVCDYFENRYSKTERSQVKSVVIDLNASYQSFIRRLFPNAKIIIDRFHIVQLVNRTFDQIRASIIRSMDDKHSRVYKALKSNWRMFHKSTSELESSKTSYIFGINEYMTQQNLVDLGLSASSKLRLAYETQHLIQEAIRQRKSENLTNVIKNYIQQNSPMDTTIKTLLKNLNSVTASCTSPYSNGPIEGINRKIKALKRSCYGFKSLNHFYARILLIVK